VQFASAPRANATTSAPCTWLHAGQANCTNIRFCALTLVRAIGHLFGPYAPDRLEWMLSPRSGGSGSPLGPSLAMRASTPARTFSTCTEVHRSCLLAQVRARIHACMRILVFAGCALLALAALSITPSASAFYHCNPRPHDNPPPATCAGACVGTEPLVPRPIGCKNGMIICSGGEFGGHVFAINCGPLSPGGTQ
jgi:hypothetical protein